jgi:hypothetical protein
MGLYRVSARSDEHNSSSLGGIRILEEALSELVLTLHGGDPGPDPPESP